MKYTTVFTQIFLVVFVLSLSSCATIFTPKNQKVRFTTVTPGATIRYADDSIGTGTAKQKMRKNYVFQAVEVEKKGFISGSYGFDVKHKIGVTAIFGAIDLMSFILAPFILLEDLSSPKIHRFDKHNTIPALKAFSPRQADEKYVLVHQTAFNIDAKDVRLRKFSRVSRYEKYSGDRAFVEKESKKIGKAGIDISNTIFTDELNNSLQDVGFIDTSKAIFTDANNSLYIDATIKKVTINRLVRKQRMSQSAISPNELVSVEMEIEWKVLDYYKQPVYTTTSTRTSDLFMVRFGNNATASDIKQKDDVYGYSTPIKKCIAQNFFTDMADLRKELASKGILTLKGKTADTSQKIVIDRPVAPGESVRLNEILKSAVTIKTAEGHGSGVLISADGYLITNYHVVAGEKQPEVIFNDGTKATANIVKVNTGADLALLQVVHTGIVGLPLSEIAEPEIGIDAWAMGTPNNIELGQSISKGIISGLRKANDLTYIQTDVKVSPGNSGGALINRKGEVMGIVSSKMIGFGTEGVGFAIKSHDVLKNLNIQYK